MTRENPLSRIREQIAPAVGDEQADTIVDLLDQKVRADEDHIWAEHIATHATLSSRLAPQALIVSTADESAYPAFEVYAAIESWIERMREQGKSLSATDYRDPAYIKRLDVADLNASIRKVVER